MSALIKLSRLQILPFTLLPLVTYSDAFQVMYESGMISSKVADVSTHGNSNGAEKFGAVALSWTRRTHDSSSKDAE